jgi:hypothetical protein
MSIPFTDQLETIRDAWVASFSVRGMGVPGAVCTGTLVAISVVGAVAHHLDPFLTPFVWLAGLHGFLWVFLYCVRWAALPRPTAGARDRGSTRVPARDPSLAAASRMLARSLILSLAALLALASGGLFSLAPDSAWLVVLAPLQWSGALALLALAFSAGAVVVALAVSEPPVRGGFFPLIGWALFSGPFAARVWAMLLWTGLVAWFLRAAFHLVLWTQADAAGVWRSSFLGPQAGQTPPPGLGGLVVAFNLALLLTLFPILGQFVRFCSLLSGRPAGPRNP